MLKSLLVTVISLCCLAFFYAPAHANQEPEELYEPHYKKSELISININLHDYKEKQNSKQQCTAYYTGNRSDVLIPVKAIKLTGWEVDKINRDTYKFNYKGKSYIYRGEYITGLQAKNIFSLNVQFHGYSKNIDHLFTVSNKDYVQERWPWLINLKGYLRHPNPVLRWLAVILLGRQFGFA